MNRFPAALILILLSVSVTAAAQDPAPAEGEPPPAEEPMSPQEVLEKASYGVGLQLGGSFKYQEFAVDTEALLEGVRDGVAGAQPRYAADEIEAALAASRRAANRAIAARNRKVGEAFLAANALKQGVYSLPSGLQYVVLESGDGPKPKAGDLVTVAYRTTLIDGTEIDDTRGEPRTHALDKLVAGWAEALELMPVGSRWRLFLPPDLAHGDRGTTGIEPGQTTIFEIELLAIAEPEPPPAAAESGGS